MYMKVDLYNQQGKELKGIELNESIFGVEPNKALLTQYVRRYLANQRQGTVKVKTRGEVSGGGRKPWRQKGTGRARHGSIRSPLWVGGGVAHGPRIRNWRLSISKKMKRAALFSSLTLKLQEGGILVLDQLELPEFKTKAMVRVLKSLSIKDKVLVVIPTLDKNVILSARNLKSVKTIQAKDINAYEVLNHQTVLLPKGSLGVIEETFLTKVQPGKRKPRKKDKNVETKEVKREGIDELGLSQRALKALKNAGVKTVAGLASKTEKELGSIKGVGEKSVGEINRKLKSKMSKGKTTTGNLKV